MPYAWVLNLDAELELARRGHNPSTKLNAQLREHVEAARRLLLGDGDRLVDDGAADASGWLGRAWCPTPRALQRLTRAGARPEPHPSAEVLRRVNHRRFAFDLGAGPPGAAYVERPEQVRAHVLDGTSRWLLKRPLSFSGRGQLRLEAAISAVQWSWIEASLATDGLVLEPRVVPSTEFSIHGFIWRDGRYELGSPCVQTTTHGIWRGARAADASDLSAGERLELGRAAQRASDALIQAGYFGPFGVDAYRYDTGRGQPAGFCALSEINARFTMSFSVGFPRHPSQLSL